jgi:hypothetical protein
MQSPTLSMSMIMIATPSRRPASHAFKVPVVRELPPRPQPATGSTW